MAPGKRKLADRVPRSERPKKRIRKQTGYHSSSDEEAQKPRAKVKKVKVKRKSPVHNLESSSEEEDNDIIDEAESEEDEDEEENSGRKKSKRNDPNAFSTSISKILSTKLSQTARADPVLSRSREAAQTSSERANERLEHKAKAKIKADKQQEFERGRNKDVLGIERGVAGEVAEEEKKLRKIATRGVIQLFNAFHAAHVRAEQAAKEERKKGTIGIGSREEKVMEQSKQGFLELIGGKKSE